MAKLVLEGPLTDKGFEQIADCSGVVTLTVPTGAWIAVIHAEAQAVRWRNDGTNPTAAIGLVIAAGEDLILHGAAALAAIKFIEEAASAKLNVQYYTG